MRLGAVHVMQELEDAWSNEKVHEICIVHQRGWASAEAILKVEWIQQASVPHQRKI